MRYLLLSVNTWRYFIVGQFIATRSRVDRGIFFTSLLAIARFRRIEGIQPMVTDKLTFKSAKTS